ncbi:MAG: hypothetical protein IT388_01545 [Nitrospirales bacterium]|nr:hypothetical protein [Nitrospirales bacterium]
MNGKKEEVTFFFDDADIFEVAQTVFGEVLKVNYIIDPKVKGRVNFRTTSPIHRDRILSVMEIIFRLNGIAIVEEGGIYRIIPIGDVVKEPAPILFGNTPESVELKGTAIVQVVPLQYMSSTEMVKVLAPLLTQGGSLLDVPKKNFIIIADTDANVKRLLQLVGMFDENTYQDIGQPKIYVYPLQYSKADHVSKILQQVFLGTSAGAAQTRRTATTTVAATTTTTRTPQPAPVQPVLPLPATTEEPIVATGTKIFPDEVTNSIVIYASPVDYLLIQGTIRQIDIIPRQVMIEALVASVTLTDNLRFGIQWSLDTDINITNIKPFKNDIKIGGTLEFQSLISSPTFQYTASDSSGKVRLLLQSLAEDNKAKVLSSPHILVSDNREARIQVGDQVPIATSQTTNTETTPAQTTTTIQYKDTGTILKVKPQINDSGLITLEVSQEVSTVSTQTVLGTEQFVISKREVATNLVLQDGQTIVIGGLISENASKGRSGIPLLSRVPLLGHLFGSSTNDNSRTELIILLTPRVVRNQSDAANVTSQYMQLFKDISKELHLEERTRKIKME